MLRKPGISTGLMGHLARMQTLRFFTVPLLHFIRQQSFSFSSHLNFSCNLVMLCLSPQCVYYFYLFVQIYLSRCSVLQVGSCCIIHFLSFSDLAKERVHV